MNHSQHEYSLQHRGNVAIVIGLGALIILNFGFDWWRRYDFEVTARKLEERLKELDLAGGDIKMATAELEARLSAASGVFDRVLELARALRSRSSAPEVTSVPESPATTTLDSPSIVANATSTRSLLETPLEVMEPVFETIATDQYVREQYSKFNEPANWDVMSMIGHFEELFSSKLSDDERELLRLELETYKSAAAAADTLYYTQRNIELLERVMQGDVEKPQLDGTFPPHSVESIPAGDEFSFTLGTNYRIRWQKSRYPDMYRTSRISQYIVFEVLNVMRSRFSEGR